MASNDERVVERVTKDVLEEFQKCARDEYDMMEPVQKKEVLDTAKETVRQVVTIEKDFRNLQHQRNAQKTTGILANHLSEENIQLIKNSLKILTYRTETNENNQTISEINMQAARIVVGIISFGISVCGTVVKVIDEFIVRDTAQAIETSSVMQKAVKEFTQAWNETSDFFKLAEAVFKFLQNSKMLEVIWTVIKGLFTNKTRCEWLLTCVKVFALIIASIDTGGAALVAEIVLALTEAANFINMFREFQEPST